MALTPKQKDALALNQQALAALDRRDWMQTEALLARALAAAPDNPDSLQLMGVLRGRQGRPAEAENCYRASLAHAPDQPHVHHNLGNLLRTQRRLDEAITEEREAIRLKRNYIEAHVGLALALSDAGDHAEAEKNCRRALQIQPNYLPARQALAAELNDLDRPKEAEQILRQTLVRGVADPHTVAALEHNLGVALKLQGRFEEALAHFDTALVRAPGLPAADFNRGDTLLLLGRFEEAANSFRKALEMAPGSPQILALLALTSAQAEDFANARDFAARALAAAPGQNVALVALALADIAEGAFEQAADRLRVVLGDAQGSSDRHVNRILGIAADTFDRHGETSLAFDVYEKANERRRAVAAPVFEHARAIDETKRLEAYFEKSPSWSRSPLPDAATGPSAHAFVLGFMRSGTTLLSTILASHPDVVAIDEFEHLTEQARAFLTNDTGLDRLAALGEHEAAKWRNLYWKSVSAAGFHVAGKVFVDKMPFNSLRLPLIARLFPGAKMVFAIRDPRDVVLSCFRRRFDIGPYSFEFLRLEDCARFYAATMNLADCYRRKLPLEILDHRYEDMIGDFDGSIRKVCDFIGIDYRESLRDFRAAADAVDRRSASAAQVRRGLYGEAAGQWRRYRDELAPVMPILAPWIEKFGYPPE